MTSHENTNQLNEHQHDINSLPKWAKDLILQQGILIEHLMSKVHELEAHLAKNSSNSSKPPSSDGLKKPPKTTSQRGKSERKPGGQNGHQGRTLKQVDAPDHIVTHSPATCEGCGHSLKVTKNCIGYT